LSDGSRIDARYQRFDRSRRALDMAENAAQGLFRYIELAIRLRSAKIFACRFV
jgi:hypothetical protein